MHAYQNHNVNSVPEMNNEKTSTMSESKYSFNTQPIVKKQIVHSPSTRSALNEQISSLGILIPLVKLSHIQAMKLLLQNNEISTIIDKSIWK